MQTPIRIGLVAATAGAGVLLGVVPAVAASPTITYAGSAFGSAVRLGTVVRSGHTSQVSICTPTADTSKSNNTGAISVPNVGHIGAVVTRLRTVSTPAPQSQSSARTEGTNLFQGAVQAQAITANASVTQNGSRYATAGTSTIAGLVIDGRRIAASPAPNTVIGLPGIGHVVLNRQSTSSQYALITITVTAVVVVVDPGNSRGLPTGSVLLSSATAGLHRPTFHRASGDAYGTSAQVGSVLRSGQTAFVGLPCGGSDGDTLHNNLEASTIPGLVSTGTLTTSAVSTDSASATAVNTSARVEGLDVLNGAVRAVGVITRASAVRQGGSTTFGASGTTFTRLVIGGQVITGTPPRNTKFTVLGLGTVYVNVVTVTGQSVHAQGLRIVLGSAHGGLPAGAVINIAVADASVFD